MATKRKLPATSRYGDDDGVVVVMVQCLREIRDKAVIALNKKTDELILSMGMSHDYDVAVCTRVQ